MGLTRKQEYYIWFAINIVFFILIMMYLATNYTHPFLNLILTIPYLYIIFDYKSKYGILPSKDASIFGYNSAGQTVADYSKNS